MTHTHTHFAEHVINKVEKKRALLQTMFKRLLFFYWLSTCKIIKWEHFSFHMKRIHIIHAQAERIAIEILLQYIQVQSIESYVKFWYLHMRYSTYKLSIATNLYCILSITKYSCGRSSYWLSYFLCQWAAYFYSEQ